MQDLTSLEDSGASDEDQIRYLQLAFATQIRQMAALQNSTSFRIGSAILRTAKGVRNRLGVTSLIDRSTRRQVIASRALSTGLARSFGVRPAAIAIDTPLSLCNPSIIASGRGWLACVRGHNYVMRHDGTTALRFGDDLVNENWLVTLDEHLAMTGATKLVSGIDATKSDWHPARNGLEDIRLFTSNGRLMAIATCANSVTRVNMMAVAEVDLRDHSLRHIRFMASPRGEPVEKNWMPLVDTPAPLAIYSASPFTVVTLENRPRVLVENPTRLAHFRGSSQAIAFGARRLCVVHKRYYTLTTSLYTHKLIEFDARFEITRESGEFFFETPGIEFCAGLAANGDDCVFAYGAGDKEARLLKLARSQVESLLQPSAQRADTGG